MVSGKFSALSGAISRQQSIANISSNLANVSTVGYKKSLTCFESLLQSKTQIQQTKGVNFNRVSGNYTDFSQGPLQQTGNTFDLAINGEGFFKIRSPEGDLLTRKGNFVLDPDGRLLTDSGMPVLDSADSEIIIQNNDVNTTTISGNGTISITDSNGEATAIGRLAVVNVEDTTMLKRARDTAFSVEPEIDEIPAEQYSISQGSLETSNVNMADEMARMIDDNRTYEAYHNILKSYSKIGQKLDDLGSLG